MGYGQRQESGLAPGARSLYGVFRKHLKLPHPQLPHARRFLVLVLPWRVDSGTGEPTLGRFPSDVT